MKKTKVIISCVIGILLILNTVFVLILFRKLELSSRAITTLEETTKGLQVAYNLHIEETGETLKNLEDTIKRIQEAARERESHFSESLDSIKENQARTSSDISRKFDSLAKIPPAKTESRAVRAPEISTAPPPITPEQEDPFLPGDVRLNGLFASGKEALKAGQFTRAKEAFKGLLNLTPPIWEAHLYYIESAYNENPGAAARDREVKELLESLPEESNAGGQVSKLAGLLALETGEYDRGLSLIKEALSHNPKDRALLLRLGTAAFSYKDYETCVSSLVKAGPQEPEDIYTLGRAYQELKQWDAALYQFNFCLVVDESYFRAYKNIGQVKKETGAYGEAVEAFSRYHSHRKEAESLLALGECFLALEDRDKAVKTFKYILSRYPDSPEADRAKTLLERT